MTKRTVASGDGNLTRFDAERAKNFGTARPDLFLHNAEVGPEARTYTWWAFMKIWCGQMYVKSYKHETKAA